MVNIKSQNTNDKNFVFYLPITTYLLTFTIIPKSAIFNQTISEEK